MRRGIRRGRLRQPEAGRRPNREEAGGEGVHRRDNAVRRLLRVLDQRLQPGPGQREGPRRELREERQGRALLDGLRIRRPGGHGGP